MNKYYSKLRPVSLGTYPKNDNYIGHHNYNDRQYCDEIQDYAWGYVEYSKPLTEKEINAYDLVDASLRKFYSVMFRVNHETNKTTAKMYKEIMASTKPDNVENHGKTSDIFICWYDTKEEAEEEIISFSN